jgi:REP element-mobilizing transposase RayT
MAGVIKPEFPKEVVLITSRTMLSRLWFKLTPELCDFFHAALARYQEMYGVEIYAFCLLGNHYHLLARFPKGNRALFERDFNSIIARALPRLVKSFLGGKLWARPYRFQIVPLHDDILNWFLYTVLNPVSSGITSNPTALGRPNALNIIKEGGERICKWFNRTKYENAKRKNPNVDKERYYTNHTLKITRLPGLQHLTHKQYIEKVETLVAQRKSEIITERRSKGLEFLGEKNLTSQKAGEKPRSTKNSTRESYNPLVLTSCNKTRNKIIKIYLDITELYKAASQKFKYRNKGFKFPVNTYLPPCCIASH